MLLKGPATQTREPTQTKEPGMQWGLESRPRAAPASRRASAPPERPTHPRRPINAGRVSAPAPHTRPRRPVPVGSASAGPPLTAPGLCHRWPRLCAAPAPPTCPPADPHSRRPYHPPPPALPSPRAASPRQTSAISTPGPSTPQLPAAPAHSGGPPTTQPGDGGGGGRVPEGLRARATRLWALTPAVPGHAVSHVPGPGPHSCRVRPRVEGWGRGGSAPLGASGAASRGSGGAPATVSRK